MKKEKSASSLKKSKNRDQEQGDKSHSSITEKKSPISTPNKNAKESEK